MAVERQKESTRTPAELAKEETKKQADAKAKGESKDAPKKAAGRAATKSGEPKKQSRRAAKKDEADAKQTTAKAAPKTRSPRAKAKSAADAGGEGAVEAPEKEKASEPTAAPAAGGRKPRRARRRQEAPAERRPAVRPVVRAQAKYTRSSARKARLVVDHIRGKSVEDARAVLRHTPRGVARDVEKLLASAVANAENNHELVGDDLYVKEAYVNEGPTLKRFRPRALGRATRIRKRTSHLTVTLTPKE